MKRHPIRRMIPGTVSDAQWRREIADLGLPADDDHPYSDENTKAILSQFKTPPVEAFNTLGDNAKIIEFLNQKAQQRALNQPSETNRIAVADLAPLPAPQFFIGDRVCWSPLPGEEEPLEGGCIIGMKYWTPNFSEPPVSLEGANAEWQYLLYLNPNAPSRAWIQTDWAAESDLVFQEPHDRSPVTKPESIQLEP